MYTGSKYVTISSDDVELVPSDWKPYGIVAIPAEHGVYGDTETYGVLSTHAMDAARPETGYLSGISDANTMIMDPGIDGSLYEVYNQVSSSHQKLYKADFSDASNIITQLPTNGLNPYENTSNLATSTVISSLKKEWPSDYVMNLYGNEPNNIALDYAFSTYGEDVINSSNDFLYSSGFTENQMVMCCYRYKAPGDNVFGNWYWPTSGECWYVVCRGSVIYHSLIQVKKIDSSVGSFSFNSSIIPTPCFGYYYNGHYVSFLASTLQGYIVGSTNLRPMMFYGYGHPSYNSNMNGQPHTMAFRQMKL